MSKFLSEENKATLLQGGTIVVDGKSQIGRTYIFETNEGEKIKAYCTSWFGYPSSYSSSFIIKKE